MLTSKEKKKVDRLVDFVCAVNDVEDNSDTKNEIERIRENVTKIIENEVKI